MNRPNQALERTADRHDNFLSITSTVKPEAELALGGVAHLDLVRFMDNST